MPKKIFVASDIHDDIEAMHAYLDYSASQNADLALFLGDFSLRPYSPEDLAKFLQDNDSKAFIKAKRKHNSQTLTQMKGIADASGLNYNVIPGNYDPKLKKIFEDKELHKASTQFADAKISGYGGADAFPQHIDLLVQLGEIVPFDHKQLYNFLIRQKPSIVMTHNPPNQLCDDMFNGQNVGTPAVTQYILRHSPKLVLGGHIHEAGPHGKNPKGVRGLAVYENPNGKRTVVVNPGNLGRFELLTFPELQTRMRFDYGTFSSVDIEDDGTPLRLTHYCLDAPNRRIGDVRLLEEITFS